MLPGAPVILFGHLGEGFFSLTSPNLETYSSLSAA